jgi:hypothetical protein
MTYNNLCILTLNGWNNVNEFRITKNNIRLNNEI